MLQFSQESCVFQFSNNIKTDIYRTVVMAAVLCGLGTGCLILSEKFRHSMFENRVLRRIFGLKRESNGGVDNGELHDLYSTSNIILVMKSGRMTYLGLVAKQGAEEKYIKILVGKPEGQRQLGRPRHRWEDNIKMHLRQYGGGGME